MSTVEDLCKELGATCERMVLDKNPLITSDERLYSIARRTEAYKLHFKSDMVEVMDFMLYRIVAGDRVLITGSGIVIMLDSNGLPYVILNASVGGIIHKKDGDTELFLYVDKLLEEEAIDSFLS